MNFNLNKILIILQYKTKHWCCELNEIDTLFWISSINRIKKWLNKSKLATIVNQSNWRTIKCIYCINPVITNKHWFAVMLFVLSRSVFYKQNVKSKWFGKNAKNILHVVTTLVYRCRNLCASYQITALKQKNKEKTSRKIKWCEAKTNTDSKSSSERKQLLFGRKWLKSQKEIQQQQKTINTRGAEKK